MPKFVGSNIEGSTRIEDNATVLDRSLRGYVKLSYNQAVLLPSEHILRSLDTTDRGSAGSYAKRWYRWFALASDVLRSPRCTESMRAGALVAIDALRRGPGGAN